LYIDDDWEHLLTQCAILENAGYCVEATDSPAAGLSSYIRNGFDAVILDFHLPFVSNGLLATVMRRFRSDIPLILISDRAELSETEVVLLDCHLSKGSSPVVILKSVYDLIDRGHGVYDMIAHGHEKSVDPASEIAGCLNRDDPM
jgi:DNA-binding response OmpR family regulator